MLNKTSAVYDWGHRKKYAPQELSLSLPPQHVFRDGILFGSPLECRWTEFRLFLHSGVVLGSAMNSVVDVF